MYTNSKYLCHLEQQKNTNAFATSWHFSCLISIVKNHSLIQTDLFYQPQVEAHPKTFFS